MPTGRLHPRHALLVEVILPHLANTLTQGQAPWFPAKIVKIPIRSHRAPNDRVSTPASRANPSLHPHMPSVFSKITLRVDRPQWGRHKTSNFNMRRIRDSSGYPPYRPTTHAGTAR